MPANVWAFVKRDASARGLSTSKLVTLLVLQHKADIEAQEAAEREEKAKQPAAAG
jgi:hypothetical protein